MKGQHQHMAGNTPKILCACLILLGVIFVTAPDTTAQTSTLDMPQLFYSPVENGVKLIWDNTAETESNPLEPNTNFTGYRMYRAQYTIEVWTLIGAFDTVDDSVYVVDQHGDTLNGAIPVNLPPICHSFIDTGGTFLDRSFVRPINGLPYFYTVVAYDRNGVETEKENYRKDEDGFPVSVSPTKRYENGQASTSLDDVRVVPNPYKATSLFEIRYEDVIMFTNLPPAAEISIYSLDGDLVKTIIHDDGTDSEKWNLISKNDQFVVSGLYYYVVRTNAEKKIGKFVIIR
jgi:hypothetical protein